MPRIVRQLLFVLTLSFCVLLTHSAAIAQAPDKDMVEVQHFTLTMANVTKFWETFGSLARIAKDHPEVKGSLEIDSDKHEDLSAIEKRIAGYPVVVSAITDHGFTVHEFLLTQVALFQSALASAVMPAGPDRAKKALEANINPANLDFMDKHKAEIEALQAKNVPKDAGN